MTDAELDVGTIKTRMRITEDLVRQRAVLCSWRDEITDALVYELTLKIAQYERTETSDPISYPSDWWQALKERWCPAWVLRKYPVQRVTTYTRIVKICPHIPIPSTHRGHFQWLGCTAQPLAWEREKAKKER